LRPTSSKFRSLVLAAALLWSGAAFASQAYAPLPTTGILSGAGAVADINGNTDALATNFSGTVAPSAAVLGWDWVNSGSSQFEFYDGTQWDVLFGYSAGHIAIPYTNLPSIPAFSVLGAVTTGAPAALPIPSNCGTDGAHALGTTTTGIACNAISGGSGGGYAFEQVVTSGLSATTTFPSTNVLFNDTTTGVKTDTIPAPAGTKQIITITDVLGNAGEGVNYIQAVPVSGSIIGINQVYSDGGSITLYDSPGMSAWVSQ
jgi:hypothetical protein